MKIETEIWLGEFDVDCGGNLIRLRHKPSATEILRTPSSPEALRATPECYGMPSLLPPNRISDGQFTWNGRTCRLPLNEAFRNNHLHGVALGREWELESSGADFAKVAFRYGPKSAEFEGFPFEFKLSLEYRFGAERMEQTMECVNLGSDAMPFGIGFHTAFNIPAPDARFRVTAGESRWDITDPRRLPSGKLVPWEPNQSFHTPQGQSASEFPLAVQFPSKAGTRNGKPFHGATLESKSRGTRIVYEAGSEYGQWCVWNDGGDKGFICIEPMTVSSNSFNVGLPPEKTGLRSLAPGEKISARCELYVERV
jgi:aldose 1-epimerase